MEKSERKRMWIFDIEFFASFEVTMILTFSADPYNRASTDRPSSLFKISDKGQASNKKISISEKFLNRCPLPPPPRYI